MANTNHLNIRIGSYNMHGFNNGSAMIESICNQHDIILLQEHWLTTSDLCKLDLLHHDFSSFGVSAMDYKVSMGILVGRPFGGTAILYRKSLSKYVKLIDCDDISGRYISVSFSNNVVKLIITNVYFPTFKHDSEFVIEISNLNAFIENTLQKYLVEDHIIGGDLNFDCVDSSIAYCLLKQVLDNFNMICCDGFLHPQSLKVTYSHNSLPQSSWLDHFFINSNLANKVSEFKIIDCGSNLSDHFPISLSIVYPLHDHTAQLPILSHKPGLPRWDKADLWQYYSNSSLVLQSLPVPSSLLLSCTNCDISDHCNIINEYYNNIVNALLPAAVESVPKIAPNSLKPYWDAELTNLKQISIDLHTLWRKIGSPTSNSVINAARIKQSLTIS